MHKINTYLGASLSASMGRTAMYGRSVICVDFSHRDDFGFAPKNEKQNSSTEISTDEGSI